LEETTNEIARLISIIEIGLDNNAFEAADKLAAIGGEGVIQPLLSLLSSSNYNTVYLAARALSKCKDNDLAIETVFELIKNGKEPFLKGILAEALSGFNCSEYFVEVLKLYLFGSLKVSAMAKEVLDEQEFAITPRVIRKAEKHWKHYVHNVKHDDDFALKKEEVESMFQTMKELFEGEEADEEVDAE
jgi:hypothetical protein